MKKKLVCWLMLCMLLLVHVTGCQESLDEQGNIVTRLDPNTTAKVEETVEAGVTILSILSAFYPALLPILTALGGVVTAWYTVKPNFMKYKTERGLYHDLASSLVELIEELKKTNPKEAAELLVKYNEIKDDLISPEKRAIVEAIIRGLRGLPPKTI